MSSIFILNIFISFITISIYAMQPNVLLKSLDGHLYSIPQNKIDISTALIEHQLSHHQTKNQSTPFTVPFSQSSLNLLFNAHDADIYFNQFFHHLSSENKAHLTTIAGKYYFNAPLITTRILDYYYETIPHMRNYMNVDKITAYLYKKLVKRTLPSTKKKSKQQSFKNNYLVTFDETENFTLIPKNLSKKEEPFFSGHMEPSDGLIPILERDKENYYVHLTKQNKKSKNRLTHLLATDEKTEHSSTSIQSPHCALLTFNKYGNHTSTQDIVHNNPIDKTLFSPNGHHLVSHSKPSQNYPYHTLLVTSTKDKTFFYIPLQTNEQINTFCFHPLSCFLMIALKKDNSTSIVLWNLCNGRLLRRINRINIDGQTVHLIQFNKNGTRMLTATTKDNDDIYVLWDTHNLKNIIPLNTAVLHDDQITLYPQFHEKTNRLVIPTSRRSLIFLDSDTGEFISHTKQRRYRSDVVTNILFFPNNIFCMTNMSLLNKKRLDFITLWNLKKGTFVANILCNRTDTRGIGLSHTLQYAITTFKNRQMIKTKLVDDHAMHCLAWIKKYSSLTNLYALYHAYIAYKQKRRPSQNIITLLDQLPTSPCNVRKMVKSYLLRPMQTHKNNAHNKKKYI